MVCAALILALGACIPLPLLAPFGHSHSSLIFDDEFPGSTLNSSRWVTYLGAQGQRWGNVGQLPRPYSAETQGGFDVAMYAPSQVSVHKGLVLTAQRNTNRWAGSYPWLSGIVTTEGKFTLPSTGWYVQVKAQLPDTSSGMWPAIWFLPPTAGTPFNEFDGLEGGLTEGAIPPNTLMQTNYVANQGQQQSLAAVGMDLSAGVHVYGFQYLPGQSVTAYLDGKQVYRITASSSLTITAEPYQIMLQLQVAGQLATGWHTVAGQLTPASSMRVIEVQAYA